MANPRQRTAAFILALLLLAGCSRSTQPQAGQSPAPEAAQGSGQTAEPATTTGCVGESGEPPTGAVGSAYVRRSLCPAYIHTDPATVTFRLPAGVTEIDARESLTVTGASSEQVRFNRTRLETVLSVRLPAGRAGDAVTVRLAGPVGAGGETIEMGFQLTRVETPSITTEVKVGNAEFEPLAPGATLPRQPLVFRFTLTGEPRRDRVEHAVQEALRHKGALTPYTTAWEGDSRLVVAVPEPPPAIFFRFNWLEANRGLQVQRSSVALYTGQSSPQLVALDPATRQETAVGELPVDVLQSSLSADGAWATFTATAPDAAEQEEVWVVNAWTGQSWRTGFQSDWAHRTIYWLPPDQMILPAYKAVQVWNLKAAEGKRYESEVSYWGPLSPDRRYLAGSAIDPLQVDETTLITPGSVVVLDTERMAFSTLPGIFRTRARQSSAPPYLPMVWDGSTLLLEDLLRYDKEQQTATTRWLALNPATGEVVGEAGTPPQENPPVGWPSAESGWQVQPGVNWGEIRLRSPEGQEQAAGQGLVVGWRSDGRLLLVRWENFPYLRSPEGI